MEQYSLFLKQRWRSMAACLIICVCAGFGYAWSVLQTPLIDAHSWPDSQVSLTYTITVLCSTMAPLLFGPLIRKLGTRRCVVLGALLFGIGLIACGWLSSVWQLYLFYGVLSGLGTGFIYPAMMAYVVRLFPERSGMASGLGTAAYGSGAILWAPIAAALIGRASLRGMFCILGGAFLVVILAGSFFLVEPPEGLREALCPAPDGSASAAWGLRRGEMVRTPAFAAMVAIFTCGLVAGVIVISQASPILQSRCGFAAGTAAVFVSVFAACNMAGRFLWGSLSDRLGLRRVVTAVSAVCIASMLALVLCRSAIPAVIAMCVAASCYGGFASVLTPMTAQVFGARHITENYGVMYIVFGLASLVGPMLAVRLRGNDGAYTWAFAAAALLAAVGLALNCAFRLSGRREQKHEK